MLGFTGAGNGFERYSWNTTGNNNESHFNMQSKRSFSRIWQLSQLRFTGFLAVEFEKMMVGLTKGKMLLFTV